MKRPDVQYAEPLDINAIMAAGSAAAEQQIKSQYRNLIKYYPRLENLTFGTVDRIAKGLDNQATRDAQSAVSRAIGLVRDEDADPTSIERRLYDDAERDLALGRSLSPEEIRDSQQSARAAFAARGLGTSLGSSAAEILSRDSYATQREAQRRQQAAAANNLMVGNVMNRRGMMADTLFAGAGNSINVDPYSRALGLGLNAGQNQQNMAMNTIGGAYAGANQMAGNIASFNANMLDQRSNSRMNNWAAMRGAGMQAGAMNNAATMGMIGSIGSGLLGGAGFALSDKREKKDIKPLGKAGSVLGLTAYEYKYKGEDKKHKGFMAQDVQKVLPEAVTEVDYRGKKRLAIKPAVIGAALAEELMAAKAA
jgi:hypothetical protein